jgi:hypothetical protein
MDKTVVEVAVSTGMSLLQSHSPRISTRAEHQNEIKRRHVCAIKSKTVVPEKLAASSHAALCGP